MPSLITLTTDLGQQEPFVASIKGVLCSQCPGVQVIDLSHQVSLHNVTEAALFALGSIPFFPQGTVHLVTVAPGPRPIAVKICGQFVVCPDNGILTLLADLHTVEEVSEIRLPENVRNRRGQRFFGREVFAPVAASLAAGNALASVGPALEGGIQRIDWPQPVKNKQRIDGRIMHVDRFGNLITNIHRSDLEGQDVERVAAGHFSLYGLSESYADVAEKKPLALIGPAGYLEVAYNGDRANKRLNITVGIAVNVFLQA